VVELYDALRVQGKSKLRDLHEKLDSAVQAVYGFDDGEPTAQLLALNASLHQAERENQPVRGPGASGLAGVHSTTYRVESKLLD
jgi:hypothetical protein